MLTFGFSSRLTEIIKIAVPNEPVFGVTSNYFTVIIAYSLDWNDLTSADELLSALNRQYNCGHTPSIHKSKNESKSANVSPREPQEERQADHLSRFDFQTTTA